MRKYFPNSLLTIVLALLVIAATGCACASDRDSQKSEQSTTQPIESKGVADRGVKPLLAGASYHFEEEGKKRRVQLIEDPDTFKEVLAEYGVNRVPDVDFESEVVAAGLDGFEPHLGYEVLIYPPKRDEKGDQVIEVAFVKTVETCETGTAPDSIMYPFAFAKFPRLPGGESYKVVEKDVEECF